MFPLIIVFAGFFANGIPMHLDQNGSLAFNNYELLSESCYYQRCIGCRPEELHNYRTTVECDPPNWVSALWIHSTVAQPPPGTASRVPIEYRCLKMVAWPDDLSTGNTLDIIRGCVPRAQIDSVCLSLQALQRARGRSNARCYACRGNDCNATGKLHASEIFVGLFTVFGSILNLRRYV